MKRTVLLLVLACAVCPAAEWLKAKSPNFELLTTANEKSARETLLYFEQVRAQFARIRGDNAAASHVRIIQFSKKSEYQPYSLRKSTPAYYVTDGTDEFIVMGGKGDEFDPVAVHEYTHLWLQRAGVRIPAWLNEGMAEIHSTLEQRGDKVYIGQPIPGRVYEARSGRWMPLGELFAQNNALHSNMKDDRVGMFYAESWLLTHMLYLSDEFHARWPDFLRELQRTDSTEKAVNAAFGLTVEQLDKKLQRYASRTGMVAAWFPAKESRPTDVPVVERAQPLEVDLALATLLGLTDQEAEAQAAFEKIITTHGDCWQLSEVRARLALRKGGAEAARPLYARAVEQGSNSAKTHLDYAKLFYNEEREKVAASLKRALELDASLQEAHEMLAFLLYEQRDFKGAIEHLVAMKRVNADRAFAVLSALAHCQAELGRRDDAITNARKARQFAKMPSEIQSAESLVHYIEARGQAGVTVEPDAKDENAPTLRRRGPPRESIAGRLIAVECQGESALLKVEADGRERVFSVPDPAVVAVALGESVEFRCGPQKEHRQIILEFQKPTDGDMKSEGNVVRLEFPVQ